MESLDFTHKLPVVLNNIIETYIFITYSNLKHLKWLNTTFDFVLTEEICLSFYYKIVHGNNIKCVKYINKLYPNSKIISYTWID